MTLVRPPMYNALIRSTASVPGLFPPLELLFGRTVTMGEVRRKIELVAATDVPILICGESGSGKDLLATLIHASSSRSDKPLVKVSCPAIPASLLDSELFGYEKGAFTGANAVRRGRLEQAHLGTIVLDALESLDNLTQAKLLHFLQDGTFTRVGGDRPRTISTRIISIVSGDLHRMVQDGSFRLDLLFRVNAVTLELLPLRQRQEDLPDLIDYFSSQHAEAFGKPWKPMSKDLLNMMQNYDWPGNIRQLDNLIRSFVLTSDEQRLVTELTPPSFALNQTAERIDVSKPIALREITKKATRDLEQQIIMKVLQANGWNRSKAAKWLQISPRSLFYKLGAAQTCSPLRKDTHLVNKDK